MQTTRALIRGIVIENNAQIILVDTPGIFLPKRRLDRAMVSTAWSGAHDADLVCVLLDAKAGIDEEAEAILAKLATVKHEKILVLNKIDLVPREKLLALAQGRQRAADASRRPSWSRRCRATASTISGARWPGWCRRARSIIPRTRCRMRRCGIWRPRSPGRRSIRKLHQELPYQSTVETDSWTERKDKSVRIEQTIFVERESQRKIVLGKGGATIKAIGADSRKEIAEILGHARASVPVRQGARELGRRSRPLPRDGPGIPQGMIMREDEMTGIAMNVPKNVLWFEVLLYLSLTLDALSVAFQDRTPSAEHDRIR